LTEPTSETRIPTETFLLPGQQFCIGFPWERAELPRHGLPAAPPRSSTGGSALDLDSPLAADPFAGWEIGACQVIRRLSPGSAKILLAHRDDPVDGPALVLLRRLELPDLAAQDVQTHADWAAQYRHPHLGRVFGSETADEGIFWVTELSSGASLAEIFEACRAKGKAMPVGLALSAAYEAALALSELHQTQGYAHGFVNDQSVTVAFDGNTKLQGAGLFRCIARRTLWTEVLEPMGPYLAPEQVLSGRMPDPKCDLYSLAVVLHECLSGAKVRRAGSFEDRVKQQRADSFAPPSSLNVTLGKPLDKVLAKALTHDRADRYASASDFAKDLKQAAASFMWRSEVRAQFVGELFETRKRRERDLVLEHRPERYAAKRVSTAPGLRSLPVAAPRPAPVAPPPVLAASPRPVPKTAPNRVWPLRVAALLAAVVAGLGAAVVHSGAAPTELALLLPGLAARLGLSVPAPVPPPQATLASAEANCAPQQSTPLASPQPASPAPPPEVQAAAEAVSTQPLSEPPALEALPAAKPALHKAPAPKVRSAKRRASRDDPPVPPWLLPHPARGKRAR
jgi:hypothetical protein